MKNQEIKIICTGEQKVYHNYYKPFICVSSIDMPKMYNQGYNTFQFIGGEPEFIGENMPLIIKNDYEFYTIYECKIEVYRKDGSKCSGFYYKSVNKESGETTETISFF